MGTKIQGRLDGGASDLLARVTPEGCLVVEFSRPSRKKCAVLAINVEKMQQATAEGDGELEAVLDDLEKKEICPIKLHVRKESDGYRLDWRENPAFWAFVSFSVCE